MRVPPTILITVVTCTTLPVFAAAVANIPFPASPAPMLPELNGSAFPPYRVLFIRGECTENDFGGCAPGAKRCGINTNKTCFSCFRIPTIIKTGALGKGTLLAFAEARRGEVR